MSLSMKFSFILLFFQTSEVLINFESKNLFTHTFPCVLECFKYDNLKKYTLNETFFYIQGHLMTLLCVSVLHVTIFFTFTLKFQTFGDRVLSYLAWTMPIMVALSALGGLSVHIMTSSR